MKRILLPAVSPRVEAVESGPGTRPRFVSYLSCMGELYDTVWVADEVARCVSLWHTCAAHPALPAGDYSVRDHESREIAYDAALHEVEWEAKRIRRLPHDRGAAERRMIASFARFAQNALDLDQEQIGLLTDGFLPAGIEFARRARAFDPQITREDTMQACRNAWTACGLQSLLGTPFRMTPSILAYSLLYPYSDNYLDRTGEAADAKLTFSARFRQRLSGEKEPPANRREASIWTLVAMIEQEYARAQFPEVYSCLLGIHQAQEDSIGQLGNGLCLDDGELLRLSFAKGGTSVLADACLVRGFLTSQESEAAFAWGALLQLGDDLQDVADDLVRGSQTLFTNGVRRGEPLDHLVLQLLAFCDRAAAHMRELPDGSAGLKQLLKISWQSLIFDAVAAAHEFFTPQFLKQAERCSPFRFAFLRARKARLATRQGLYATIFDQIVQQGPEADRASAGIPAASCAPGIQLAL